MLLALNNQTLLFIIIAVFIIQIIIMKYYVQSYVSEDLDKNNKRMIKKISNQIDSTFDQYIIHDHVSHNKSTDNYSQHQDTDRHNNSVIARKRKTKTKSSVNPNPDQKQSSRKYVQRTNPEDQDSIDDPADDEEL